MIFPYDIIDLTHPLSENSPSWDVSCGFQCQTTLDYQDCSNTTQFRVQEIHMPAGIGTHMDAPAHCTPSGQTIDQIPLAKLIAPCVLIDISAKVNPSYLCSAKDILEFEKQQGQISKNSFIIIRTGWDRYWHCREQYRNHLQFPSVSVDAARLLLSREILGLGIDTLSPDTEQSGFPVHQLVLGAGKYIVENIANSQKLPPIGSFVLAFPLNMVGATEAPMRLIALVAR